jgi:hypothetical protein
MNRAEIDAILQREFRERRMGTIYLVVVGLMVVLATISLVLR